jgi:DNA (cytosine-5)-methyltransferase 1
MACDIFKSARDNYNKNYNLLPLGDICEIEPKSITNFDILCAGFPCQPFSQIGKHLGFDDERGTMFSQIMKFVKFHKPKIIILENVQALLNHDDGKTFKKIHDEIENENYEIVHKILKCSDYGIPQMRKRLFIIAVNKTFNTKKINIKQIFDLDEYKQNITLSNYLGKNFQKDIAYTLRCGGKNSPINDKHNWDGYYVDDKEYRLTIEDGLKLQGFTENFELIGSSKDKWKLLGNTIPTNFTKIIGKQIQKLFFYANV